MPTITGRAVVYYSFNVLQWLAGIGAALLTFAATQSADKWTNSSLATAVISFGQRERTWIFILSATVVVSKFVCARLGSPWAWKSIQSILTRWKREIFPGTADDEHRVTVYKHTSKWCSLYSLAGFKALREQGKIWKRETWPDAWFKPLARSGQVAQKGISWFPHFDRDASKGGFIGRVWRNPEGQSLEKLPDIDADNVSQVDLNNYATAARVSPAWISRRKGKKNARSLSGIMIELDGGHNWGVLIIDSRQESFAVSRSEMTLAAVSLGKLIGRA